jgi:hypothetical protein
MAKTASVQVKVNANTIIGSTYAQIVGVTVTDTEVTLEFVYINPQIKTQGQTVARITIPRQSAEGLAKIIPETIKQHENKKKG